MEHLINLNFAPGGLPATVHVSQYDDTIRQLRFQLWFGRSKVEVPSGTSVRVDIKKPDGHIVLVSGTVDSSDRSIVTVPTTKQMTAVPGCSRGTLVVSSTGDKRISSAIFIMQVHRDPVEDGDASDSDLSMLQDAIDQTAANATAAQAAATAAQQAASSFTTDTTLSVSGKAADAAETGRKFGLIKADLNYLVSLPCITGYAVSLSQEPVDLVNLLPSTRFKWCAIVDCIEGDVFIINATGLTAVRAWAILDSSNMIISMADANAVVENLRLVMPAGASKLVVNSTSDAISYKYGKNYLTLSPQNLLDKEKEQLYENIGLKDNLKDLNEDILFKILDCLRNVSWSNNAAKYYVSRLEKECVPKFFYSTIWAYPAQNGSLINGSEIRVDVPHPFIPDATMAMLAINTSDSYSKLAVVDRGVIPYIDNDTLDDTQAYPIPVPDGINKIAINVSPADIQIHLSLWHYETRTLRYSKKDDEDYGVIGTGSAELNNIPRLPDDRMYLCVRFTKEDGSLFEVENYRINYYII